MKAMKLFLLITMTLSSIASAESLAEGGNPNFGNQIKADPTQEEIEPVADGEPCSGKNMEIRIEDYDPKTKTFEVIDTKCDGQGPWYSTMEVVGCAVPTLWTKTDPKFFVNKTYTLKKEIEFHPERTEARKEANNLDTKTCKPREGFFQRLFKPRKNPRDKANDDRLNNR